MKQLAKFFVAGVPSFLLALPLNWLLVARAGWPKPAAYALVLVLQVTINYFACRYFVFETGQRTSLWRSFAVFVNGILVFRLLDWGMYSLLTTQFNLPFIGVQLFNVAMFGLLKFEFSKRVFERRPHPLSKGNSNSTPGATSE
jgi:putative flippase GtrA